MTLNRLDHTAIAVRDLEEAIERHRRLYGVDVTERSVSPDGQVDVAFLKVGDTQLELISPRAPDSGVGRFLERCGEGLHHIAFLVDSIDQELGRLEAEGVELIDHRPVQSAHGRIAFVHPRGTGGVLVELVER